MNRRTPLKRVPFPRKASHKGFKQRKPMPPRKKGLSRSRMNKVSPQKREKAREAKRLLKDGRGRTWEEAQIYYWRVAELGTKHPADCETVYDEMHELFVENCHGDCWLCDKFMMLDAHHIFGGSSRSPERAAIVMICRPCHEKVQSLPAFYAEVIRAKVNHDRPGSDYVRLFEIHGSVPFNDLETGV